MAGFTSSRNSFRRPYPWGLVLGWLGTAIGTLGGIWAGAEPWIVLQRGLIAGTCGLVLGRCIRGLLAVSARI